MIYDQPVIKISFNKNNSKVYLTFKFDIGNKNSVTKPAKEIARRQVGTDQRPLYIHSV